MAFAEKYYYKVRDLANNTFRISIELDGFTGSTEEIKAYSSSPFSIKYRGGKDNTDNTINGSELTFNWYCKESDANKFDSLFETEYKQVKVKVYEGTGTTITHWVGWLKPENYSKEFIKETGYLISASAVDGLADLKNIDFPSSAVSGHTKIINILKSALEQTGIELDFEVQLGTYETTYMTSTECVLKELTLHTQRFKKEKDGRTYYENCYKTIEEILKIFNAKLLQRKGKYFIVNQQEINSYKFVYDWATLTQQSRTANNLIVTGSTFYSRGDLQKIRPLKNIELKLLNRNLGEDVFGGETTYTNASSPNNYYAGLFNNLTGNAYCAGTVAALDANYRCAKWVTSNTFAATSGDTYLNLNYKLCLENASYDASCGAGYYECTPWILPTIIYPSTAQCNDICKQIQAGDASYTATFPISETGNYSLRFCTIPWLSSSICAYTFKVYDVVATVLDAAGNPIDITFDKFYNVVNSGSTAVDKSEVELSFSVSDKNNDVQAIKDSVTSCLASSFNRYSKTDCLPIEKVFSCNFLNNYAKYKNYVNLNIRDTAAPISNDNVVYLNGKCYVFASYSKDYKNNNISGELVELLTDDAETELTYSTNTLTSVDGKSSTTTITTSSSSSGGGTGATWGTITGTIGSQTDLQTCFNSKLGTTGCAADSAKLGNQLPAYYEPAFTKNTAFNKNFGGSAGTVSEGNHSHTFLNLTDTPTTHCAGCYLVSTGGALNWVNNPADDRIINPVSKSTGQVLTYDGASWVACTSSASSAWSNVPANNIIYNGGSCKVLISNSAPYTPTEMLEVVGNIKATGAFCGTLDGTATCATNAGNASCLGGVVAANYSQTSHNHTGVYEPAFTKNTGFNKNFGTTAGTVAEGNHTHAGYASASHTHTFLDLTDTPASHIAGCYLVSTGGALNWASNPADDRIINPASKSTGQILCYNGSSWIATTLTAGGSSSWADYSSDVIYNGGSRKVLISNAAPFSPTALLHVAGDACVTGTLYATVNNTSCLNGQLASYYTNASNLASGNVPLARLATGTCNILTFLRGDGTWAEPPTGGGSTGFIIAVKPSDTARVSTTTKTDDPHLITETLDSGTWYEFEMQLLNTAGTAEDISIAMASTQTGAQIYYTNATATLGVAIKNLGTATSINGAGVTAYRMSYFKGIYYSGSSAGVLSLKWAQLVSGTNASTMRAGSFIKLLPLVSVA